MTQETPHERDTKSEDAACANGLVWEIGNGLARTTVVVYLAREYGAGGLAIGLIAASQHLAGGLRFLAPEILRRFPQRKSLAIATFVLSALLLVALPMVAAPGVLPTKAASLAALVGDWIAWHLVMFVGVIALFSWFGDLVPASVRGEFFGRRERYRMIGAVGGALAAGGFAFAWIATNPKHLHWLAYAIPTCAGGFLMLLAVIPLVDMRPIVMQPAAAERPWREVFADPRYRRFLAFACWGAFANGVSQAPQFILPSLLGLPVIVPLALDAGLRLAQSLAAPYVGRLIDRVGNRGVLIGSQLLTAGALGFYLFATKQQPYWIVGAWIFWIAYVGQNVALPNTLLALCPDARSPRHIAGYYACVGLAVGLGGVLGGAVFDQFARNWSTTVAGVKIDRFQLFFLLGIALRASAVAPLLQSRKSPQ